MYNGLAQWFHPKCLLKVVFFHFKIDFKLLFVLSSVNCPFKSSFKVHVKIWNCPFNSSFKLPFKSMPGDHACDRQSFSVCFSALPQTRGPKCWLFSLAPTEGGAHQSELRSLSWSTASFTDLRECTPKWQTSNHQNRKSLKESFQ